MKNDDAQYTALSQKHKDAFKAQKDALVPFVAQRKRRLRMKPHLEPLIYRFSQAEKRRSC